MPRRLDPKAASKFRTHYELGDSCGSCGSGNLTVTVWDHYGTQPEDGRAEAASGRGTFIAAIVVCEDCGSDQTLNRAALAAKQAAE
jgi:hypothetical protein